jgi:hypothetical protein
MPNFRLDAGRQPPHNLPGEGSGPMIEVIVTFRDAVFAALVAWTGVTEAEPPKAAKDKDQTRGKPAAIEKPVEQPAPKIY